MTSTAATRAGAGVLAVRADRLFDGVDAEPLPRAVVLLQHGRIIAVGSGLQPPADAGLVDLGPVTLLPGLIDSHVHLVFNAGRDPVGHLAALDDQAAAALMRANARLALT